MERYLNINSRALKAAKYNSDTKILEVMFNTSNKWYTSRNVPERIVNEFENADSQGRYYDSNIKELYR